MSKKILDIANKPVKGHIVSNRRAREIAWNWSIPSHSLHEFAKSGEIDKITAVDCMNRILLEMQPEGFYVANVTRNQKDLAELTALLNYFKKSVSDMEITYEFGKNTHYGHIMAIETGGVFATAN